MNFSLAAVVWLTAATACFGFQHGRFGSIGRTSRFGRNICLLSQSTNVISSTGNDESERPPLRIGIAGAGAIAFGTASMLSKHGCNDVSLWSPSGGGTTYLASKNEQTTIRSTGALQHELVPKIVRDAEQLVSESDVLIIAIPANGHKLVFDLLAPSLNSASQSTKHIIISSQSSLGGLYLSQLLQRAHHTITCWGTTVCTARRTSGFTVDIKTIRKSVDTCCIPETDSSLSLVVCRQLFPDIDFRPREGLLAISLSNLNPQNHLAISLGNISRMEKGEEWYQFQNITPRIGGFLEGLDKERLEIAAALGLDVKTVYEHFSLSFHVEIPKSGSISEMCQEINRKGNDVCGPNIADSRYITEDVPFGLALIVALGKLVGRPAVLHESGLVIFNAMYGRDFTAENDLLQALSMDSIELDDLKDAALTGKLKNSLDKISSPF